MKILEGKSAIVTGGSLGIGAAIARALGQAGANVAVNYRRHDTEARQVVEAVEAVGQKGLALQAACERAAIAAGFPAEERPFRGHLTLARFRTRVLRPALPPVDLGAIRLERLVMLRSDLRPGGAVYSSIDRFPLGRRGVD